MSNKIQLDKKIRMCLDFIFLKQGFIIFYLFIYLFFIFLQGKYKYIDHRKKQKTKQGIKQVDKKIKKCLNFIFLKQGFIFFFYSEDTSILIIKKKKKTKNKKQKQKQNKE